MQFLCDVHIPIKLVKHLQSLGFNAIHVNNILNKWETTDSDICNYANTNDYVVITKDMDFQNSFFVSRSPRKLIKVSLGNIPNDILLKIFSDNITILKSFEDKEVFMIDILKDEIMFTIV